MMHSSQLQSLLHKLSQNAHLYPRQHLYCYETGIQATNFFEVLNQMISNQSMKLEPESQQTILILYVLRF